MKVLITAASRHGATLEIACAIASTLEAKDIHAPVLRIDEVGPLDGYDAVVLGSAIYMGRWLDAAKDFIDIHLDQIGARPLWLFSSGPLGDLAKAAVEPEDVAALMARTHARGHHLFSGRLTKRELGFGEKVIASAVRAPEGDFRSWPEIDGWATDIARSLEAEAAVPVPAG
jgi:menaquinone-dependent protoporphyrinogen oxidase